MGPMRKTAPKLLVPPDGSVAKIIKSAPMVIIMKLSRKRTSGIIHFKGI